MKKTTTYLYLLLAFIYSLDIQSQTIVQGTITEASSGEPLIGANIIIALNDEVVLGLISDIDGKYKTKELLPGKYTFSVDYTGYQQVLRIENVKRNKINTIDFALNEGMYLDEVIVKESYPTRVKKNTAFNAYDSEIPSTTIKRSSASYDTYEATVGYGLDLPASGQVTAGEWNDLHNWKDWVALLEDDNYNIMAERFQIFPTERYSVVAVNTDNAVMSGIPVQLLDESNNVLWSTHTDNAGKAELWGNAFSKDETPSKITVDGKVIRDFNTIDEGSNTAVIDLPCKAVEKVDVVFTVDATSSMSDEISYLKAELLDVIDRIQATNEGIDFRLGSVFYRDINDDYLTKETPITANHEEVVAFVENQRASGGGDKPEAVDEALRKTLDLNWREDAIKIAFLILDAPPHEDDGTLVTIRKQIEEAALKGIKLIPITASGIDRETEFLMKFMAMMTNGTYVFITDDSGIGNPHLAPVVDDYEVEKLNDCIVRLISLNSKSYSCEIETAVLNTSEIKVYPNPSTQYVNIEAEVVPSNIRIFSSNGMVVKTASPTEKTTRIELDDLVNGVYTVSVFFRDTVKTKQIILLK